MKHTNNRMRNETSYSENYDSLSDSFLKQKQFYFCIHHDKEKTEKNPPKNKIHLNNIILDSLIFVRPSFLRISQDSIISQKKKKKKVKLNEYVGIL